MYALTLSGTKSSGDSSINTTQTCWNSRTCLTQVRLSRWMQDIALCLCLPIQPSLLWMSPIWCQSNQLYIGEWKVLNPFFLGTNTLLEMKHWLAIYLVSKTFASYSLPKHCPLPPGASFSILSASRQLWNYPPLRLTILRRPSLQYCQLFHCRTLLSRLFLGCWWSPWNFDCHPCFHARQLWQF